MFIQLSTGNGKVVAFGQIAAVEISRQQNVRARRELQIRFVDVAGSAGDAVVNIVGGRGFAAIRRR